MIKGATLAAVRFSMSADVTWTRGLVSREARSKTKSSVHNSELGYSPEQGCAWCSNTSKGVCDLLKHVVRKEFSSAFCISEWAVALGVVKVGIEEVVLSLQVFQNSFVFVK